MGAERVQSIESQATAARGGGHDLDGSAQGFGGPLPAQGRLLLSLQQSAGNRAVSGLVQRWRSADTGLLRDGLEAGKEREEPLQGWFTPVQLQDFAPEELELRASSSASGNPAAAKFVTEGRSGHSGPPMAGHRLVVQRQLENVTVKEGSDKKSVEAATKFFGLVDDATQKAYEYVVTVPSLHGLAKLDGHTTLWVKLFSQFVAGGKPKAMAAAFGYAVESLVSLSNSPFAAKTPQGYSMTPQLVSGGTRPDLVLRLTKGSTDIAWVDLTASKSATHIFDKESWDKKIGIFAEVTYPSLDPWTLALMRQNKGNTGSIDRAEFEKRAAKARVLHEKRTQHWHEFGKQLTYGNLSWEIGFGKEVQQLDPNILRQFIANKLKDAFGADEIPDQKMVSSILAALGVPSVPWGYTTGFNQNEKAGEAWLIDNDPSLPEV